MGFVKDRLAEVSETGISITQLGKEFNLFVSVYKSY